MFYLLSVFFTFSFVSAQAEVLCHDLNLEGHWNRPLDTQQIKEGINDVSTADFKKITEGQYFVTFETDGSDGDQLRYHSIAEARVTLSDSCEMKIEYRGEKVETPRKGSKEVEEIQLQPSERINVFTVDLKNSDQNKIIYLDSNNKKLGSFVRE